MSSWHQYLEEKTKIDDLIARGYRVAGVTELFDGDDVKFVRDSGGQDLETVEVRLATADGRKYLGSVLIAQLRSLSAT